MHENELKICPRCGGEATVDRRVDEDGEVYFYAQCQSCNAKTYGFITNVGAADA